MDEENLVSDAEGLVSNFDDDDYEYSEATDSIDQLESRIEDEIRGFVDYDCGPIEESNDTTSRKTLSLASSSSSSIQYEKMPLEEQLQEESNSFALDFYHSGTDWSSLLNNDNCNRSRSIDNVGRLKQTNLLHLWGFEKKKTSNSLSSSDALLSKKVKTDHQVSNLGCSFNKALFKSLSTPKVSACVTYHISGVQTSVGASPLIRQCPRLCPFYKKIPGTSFTIDAFRYGQIQGCSAYFLTHFHADHYGGLSKSWCHGPIYCTPLTARLVKMCLSVQPSFIRSLELGTEYFIDGVKVTMLDANHCPGASLIHFCLSNGQCYLHTGDFRASKLMQDYSILVKQRINILYLDTTYCNPKYRFPSKEDVLEFVVRITQISLKRQQKTLVIVGSYSIGKECVYLAISKALGVGIYANPSRRRILQSFGWPEMSENLCTDGKHTPLHVLPVSSLKFQVLEHYLKSFTAQYTAVLAFRPTGWTYSENIGSQLDLLKPSRKGNVTIYGVPYSEHSSFTELRDFVQFLKPGKIIPTVNVGNASNRDKMQSYFREWMKH